MNIRPILLLLGVIALPVQARAASFEPMIEREYPQLQQLYFDLHRNPELSFQEQETAQRLAAELGQLGFDVSTGVGGHGVVGVLKNGKGPTVLLRTDLDALPVREQTGVDYASNKQATNEFGKQVHVMHACGHDIHMTVFVGTARLLVALKKQWRGTLVMIGQPAEERGAGAKAMLADGLFERFPRPDYNLALHVAPSLPAGKVAYTPEWALANVDSVDIQINGVGGHGSMPHTSKDPVVLAAQTILALQTLVSREVSPLEPAVVTVGSIHGGTQHNIIGDRVDLQLTVRSFTDDVRRQLLQGIERIVLAQARSFGIAEDKLPKIVVRDQYTPSVYNNPQLTERLAGVFGRLLGAENILKVPPTTAGEDFSRYGRAEPKIPSLIFWLGAVDPEKMAKAAKEGEQLPSLHSPFFAPLPKPTIQTGVKAMVGAALDLLAKP